MSEVKRYTMVGPDWEAAPDATGKWIRAFDYDAAQSELAALREELAAEKKWYDREIDAADEETSTLRECIRDLKDWREHSQSFSAFESIIQRAEAVISAPGPLRKALTAAEQRNAKLERVLAQLLNEDDGLRAAAELSTGFVWCALQRHAESIDAALKPTESGASE